MLLQFLDLIVQIFNFYLEFLIFLLQLGILINEGFHLGLNLRHGLFKIFLVHLLLDLDLRLDCVFNHLIHFLLVEGGLRIKLFFKLIKLLLEQLKLFLVLLELLLGLLVCFFKLTGFLLELTVLLQKGVDLLLVLLVLIKLVFVLFLEIEVDSPEALDLLSHLVLVKVKRKGIDHALY